jgi:hypothetical protein
MTPRIIRNGSDFSRALAHLESLKGMPSGASRDSEIELWSVLLEHYEESRTKREGPSPPIATAFQAGKEGTWPKDFQKYLFTPRIPEGPNGLKRSFVVPTWAFFFGCVLLLYLRLLYHGSYFPSFFEGEEAKSLDLAKSTYDFANYTHSWWQSVVGGAMEYNKGYSWVLVPFYIHFGYDVRLITYILPVFFGIFCATFFTIYRKTYPNSSLLSFVLITMFSVLCLSLRRYKWHTLAYLTAISVYLYFLPYFYGSTTALRRRCLKVLSLFLFAFSCFFYFGGFVYAIPFFGLVFYFSSRVQRRRELILASMGFMAFLAVLLVSVTINNLWWVRISEELQYIMDDFSVQGLKERWWATRDFFFTLDLSLPFLAIFIVGLVASIRKMRRGDRFALVNTALLAFLWAFEMAIQGLNNPDQLNWSMIPLLGLLLIGADEILVHLRDKVRHGTAIGALLVLVLGWHEMDHYLKINRDTPYQPFVQPRNTMAEGAMILMMIRDDDSGSVQYYLPDPSMPTGIGGFEYNVSLQRVDFIKAMQKVTFFTDEDDLRRKLASQRGDKPAVVYLSVGEIPHADKPKDEVDPAKGLLLGQMPTLIHPFADIYGIEYMVREFRMRGGLPDTALSPGHA